MSTTTRPRVAVRYPTRVAPPRTASPSDSLDAPWSTPTRPPRSWFDLPAWCAPGQRLTIDDTGRIYGYLATFDTPMRLADGRVWTAPRSPSNYRVAHQGAVTLDDGDVLACAVLGARGHSEDGAHYSDPSTARAVVRFVDTHGGIALAGAILPGTTAREVDEVRRCSLSGDWRGGDLI